MENTSLNFPADSKRPSVFHEVRIFLEDQGFNITLRDDTRPWGGFYYIDEKQAPKFIDTFFSHLDTEDFRGFDKLSPKILLVAPKKRLSWQYHHRRSEIWKVIGGKAGVIVSNTEKETPVRILSAGGVISLRQGQCHRLVGLAEWGILAEIWQHTDSAHPSDEDDIVRLQDDFGR